MLTFLQNDRTKKNREKNRRFKTQAGLLYLRDGGRGHGAPRAAAADAAAAPDAGAQLPARPGRHAPRRQRALRRAAAGRPP